MGPYMKIIIRILIICILLIAPQHLFRYDPSVQSNEMITNIKDLPLLEKTVIQVSNQENFTFTDEPRFFVQPNKPFLPVYTYQCTFPFGTRIHSINISFTNITLTKINSRTTNTPHPLNPLYDPNIITSTSNSKIRLQQMITILKDWYDIRLGTGIKDNERILFVNIAVYPIFYVRTLNQLIIPNEIALTFEYEMQIKQSNHHSSYDLLIITTEEFKNILQPYLNHKKNNTKILLETLENIPHQGRDIQEDIKLYIKDQIEEFDIKNVLFVGGYNKIPVRNVFVQEIRSILMDDNIFISDLYYADIYDADGLFCSWDSNNNNIFGEFKLNDLIPSDKVDLYPDVYFGRLACRTIEEVNITIEKIITYENIKKDLNWFSNAIMIGSDTFTEDILGISEGEEITKSISQILRGFNITKLWGSNGKLHFANDISNAIEKGAGFVAFDGHAGSNSYRTHPSKSPSEWIPLEWYRTYHINELSNQNKLPIVSINACNTCKFSVNHTSFGWSFIINPNGGSIATVGMTCLSWIYPGIFCTYGLGGLIHQKFYKSYISGATTFGQMWADSITQYLNDNPWYLSAYDHKTLKGWQPFGDPTLILPQYDS